VRRFLEGSTFTRECLSYADSSELFELAKYQKLEHVGRDLLGTTLLFGRNDLTSEKEDRLGRGFLSSLMSFIYFVVGLVIANSHRYFAHVAGFKSVVSAALAVVLWPLILLGVNLHIH